MNKYKNPNSKFDILGKDVVWPAALLLGTIAVAGAYQAVPGGGKDVAPIRPTETQAPTHEAVSSPVVFPTEEARGIYSQFNPAYEQAGSAMVQEIIDSANVLAKARTTSVKDPIGFSNGPTNDHVATQEAGVTDPVDAGSVTPESAGDAPASIVSSNPETDSQTKEPGAQIGTPPAEVDSTMVTIGPPEKDDNIASTTQVGNQPTPTMVTIYPPSGN